jgi:hypothetical protein
VEGVGGIWGASGTYAGYRDKVFRVSLWILEDGICIFDQSIFPMKKAILLYTLLLPCLFLYGQFQFDAAFDSGRLDSAYVSGNSWTLSPPINIHCRISGVKDSIPAFRIFDQEGYRLRYDHRMVYRYEGETEWHYFDNGDKTGSVAYYYFSNNSPFIKDTVYLAYWFPWSFAENENFLLGIASHPFVQNFGVRGNSVQGRPLYGFAVTDPGFPSANKMQVVITGKQHPTEFIHSRHINGIIDYLLNGTDSIALALRQHYIFHFYPMLNPDGVFNGLETNMTGSGLNRDWVAGTSASGLSVEIDAIRPAIWNDTGGHADFAIDFHSNPGHRGQYYWWGLKDGPTPDTVARASELIGHIAWHDAADHGGLSLTQDSIWGNTYGGTALTAGNWFNGTLKAIGFTFESGSVPPQSLQRLEEVGVSICKGFYEMIPASSTGSFPDPKGGSGFILFPNPASENVGIRFVTDRPQSFRIKLIDNRGRKVLESETGLLSAGFQEIELDLKDGLGQVLRPGLYAVLMDGERGRIFRKLVVR